MMTASAFSHASTVCSPLVTRVSSTISSVLLVLVVYGFSMILCFFDRVVEERADDDADADRDECVSDAGDAAGDCDENGDDHGRDECGAVIRDAAGDCDGEREVPSPSCQVEEELDRTQVRRAVDEM